MALLHVSHPPVHTCRGGDSLYISWTPRVLDCVSNPSFEGGSGGAPRYTGGCEPVDLVDLRACEDLVAVRLLCFPITVNLRDGNKMSYFHPGSCFCDWQLARQKQVNPFGVLGCREGLPSGETRVEGWNEE